MRLLPSLLTCIGASALALAAHAQETTMPPSADAPVTQGPETPGNVPAPGDSGPSTMPDTSVPDATTPPPPPPPAAYNAASTTAPPAQIEMSPPQPVVQAAPTPPADYPLCSRTITDACRNRGEGAAR